MKSPRSPKVKQILALRGRAATLRAEYEAALVGLEREAWCPNFVHGGDTHPLPAKETRTDANGRFTIGGGVLSVPCAWAFWTADLTVIAPGYLVDTALDTELYTSTERSVRSGLFELDRIRYRLELDEYARVATSPPATAAGSLWAMTLPAAQRLSVRPAARPGVFASQPGAVFDRVATVERAQWRRLLRWSVIAQDRTTGALYGWTTKGTPERLPPFPAGASILTGRRPRGANEPLFVQPDRLYFAARDTEPLGSGAQTWVPVAAQFGGTRAAVDWGVWVVTLEAGGGEVAVYDLDRWIEWYVPTRNPGEPREILPGPRLAVADLLPGARSPVECMTSVGGGHSVIAFIAPIGDERAVFLLRRGPEKDPRDWKAKRVEVMRGTLRGEVTACAGGENALYVALKGQGIRRLEIREESTGPLAWKLAAKVTASATPGGPTEPLNFSALAVGNIGREWEVLYAVAGDDAIYRFSADLRPDQRVEVELPSPAAGGPSR